MPSEFLGSAKVRPNVPRHHRRFLMRVIGSQLQHLIPVRKVLSILLSNLKFVCERSAIYIRVALFLDRVIIFEMFSNPAPFAAAASPTITKVALNSEWQ